MSSEEVKRIEAIETRLALIEKTLSDEGIRTPRR